MSDTIIVCPSSGAICEHAGCAAGSCWARSWWEPVRYVRAAPPPAADAVSEAMTDAALNAWWGGDYWRDDEDSVVAESRRSMRAAIAAALAARDTK
jgi:hypothetical protein